MSMKKWFCSCALLKISLCSNNRLKMIQQKVNIDVHYYFVNDKIRAQAQSRAGDTSSLWSVSWVWKMFWDLSEFQCHCPILLLKNKREISTSGNSLTAFCQSQAFLSICNFTAASLQLVFVKYYVLLSHFNAVLFWKTLFLKYRYLLSN